MFCQCGLAGLGGVLRIDQCLVGGGIHRGGLCYLSVNSNQCLICTSFFGLGSLDSLGIIGRLGCRQRLVRSRHSSLDVFLFFSDKLVERILGIRNGFLSHGYGCIQCDHLGFGFRYFIERGLVRGLGDLDGSCFLLNNFQSHSVLLCHGLGVQGETLDLFAIGRIPDVDNAIPITANHKLTIMAGDRLRGNVSRKYKITLLATVSIPECRALIASAGYKQTSHGSCKRGGSTTMRTPAFELASFVNIEDFRAAIHTRRDNNIGGCPLKSRHTITVAERADTLSGFGLPDIQSPVTITTSHIFPIGAKSNSGNPIGVFFNLVYHLSCFG